MASLKSEQTLISGEHNHYNGLAVPHKDSAALSSSTASASTPEATTDAARVDVEPYDKRSGNGSHANLMDKRSGYGLDMEHAEMGEGKKGAAVPDLLASADSRPLTDGWQNKSVDPKPLTDGWQNKKTKIEFDDKTSDVDTKDGTEGWPPCPGCNKLHTPAAKDGYSCPRCNKA